MQAQQPSPTPRPIDAFKLHYFQLLRAESAPAVVEQHLLAHRALLEEKLILHLHTADSRCHQQLRYSLLALALVMERRREYDQRWATFYEIVNEILKVKQAHRRDTGIEGHLVHFTLFLLRGDLGFFGEFVQARQLLMAAKIDTKLNSLEDNVLSAKKAVKITNSLLCLKLITVTELLTLVREFNCRTQNRAEFLGSIEEKLTRRLIEFEGSGRLASSSQLTGVSPILSTQNVFVIFETFQDLDPEGKIRKQLQQFIQKTQTQPARPLQRKQGKNLNRAYPFMLNLLIKQIMKNQQIAMKTKKLILLEFLSQSVKIDEELFDYLLELESTLEDNELSGVIMAKIEMESLKFITVSRLKAILKRMSTCRNREYEVSLRKNFRILRLACWVAKKFNESNPKYEFKLNSTIKISNLSKAKMVIFTVDFSRPHVGKLLQFNINKMVLEIIVKFTEKQQNYTVEVLTEIDGKREFKQSKKINRWAYLLCMVSLNSKKEVDFMIDGAFFRLPLKENAIEIDRLQFGPYFGYIKDLYVLENAYQLAEIHKKYFTNLRKMDLLLKQLGEHSFIYAFDKGKTIEQTKWFWKRQMAVQFNNVDKIRSISFSEGIEQLGGFPALLYLVSKVVSSEKSEDLVLFLTDFFEFLKMMVNQSQPDQSLRWMEESVIHFGEFLWIILSRNQFLRSQKQLFNRVLDFIGVFFFRDFGESSFRLKVAIIENIYMNFQIWCKCSHQVKLVVLKQLENKLQDEAIVQDIFAKSGYEKILSSLLFFFMEQNWSEMDTGTFLGIAKSPTHELLARIGGRLCQPQFGEKLQNQKEVIWSNISTIMSLIQTFFYKKHLYYSQGELSALAVYVEHLIGHYLPLSVLEVVYEEQIYIVCLLADLLAMSPPQSEIIFLMFELGLLLINRVENVRNKTAVLVDGFTRNGLRGDLAFHFKAVMYVIKNSNAIYEPNPVYEDEQILSVLLGSLDVRTEEEVERMIRMGLSVEQPSAKLRYHHIAKQFETFSLTRLKRIIQLNELTRIMVECVQSEDIFPVAVLFLRIVLRNRLYHLGKDMASTCVKLIHYFCLQNKALHPQSSSCESASGLTEEQSFALTYLKETLVSFDLEPLVNSNVSGELLHVICRLNLVQEQGIFSAKIPEQIDAKGNANDIAAYFKKIKWTNKQIAIMSNLYETIGQVQTGSQSQPRVFLLLAPLWILHNCLERIPLDFQGLLEYCLISLQRVKMNSIYSVYLSIASLKNQMKKKQNNLSENRMTQLEKMEQKIVAQYQVHKSEKFLIEAEFKELASKLKNARKNKEAFLQIFKQSKKLTSEILQMMQTFILYLRFFTKQSQNSISLVQSPSPVANRKRTESQLRKKKILEIPTDKQKYSDQLKTKVKKMCLKMQKQSKKKQQIWRSLIQKNKFWASSKIKNNQCYQIHPKITGHYRLNVVRTTFDEVPYPRRKSFEHEIQQQGTNSETQETAISTSSQIIKNLISQQTLNTRTKAENPPLAEGIKISKKDSEKVKNFFYAEYVTARGVYAGILSYQQSESAFVFICKGYDFLPDHKVYKFSTIFHRIEDRSFQLKIQLNPKSQVFARRYIHRHTAVEIFSFHRAYFFNLFFKEDRERFFKSNFGKITYITDLRGEFERRKYTEQWSRGKIDNFEYLMLVNLFSGRTYNDLAQYPVMPWIITNYDENQIEFKELLKDAKSVRDLSKPSGKLNEKKFEGLKMRCQQIGDIDEQSKFLYGTMYSNPTVIYNFFIRLQPFTTLHWQHQGRKIDHADRLFSAVRDQFNTVTSSTSDNKELVPEFYYWPEFLKNRNKVSLGIKQNKEQVHDVKLPGWASTPEQFIFKMREALESTDTGRNLHHWIDLIFGYKNPKEVALDHDNLFHYRTYEHDIFETETTEQGLKGAQITISEFGQIPYSLFTKPHPQKLLSQVDNLRLQKCISMKKPGLGHRKKIRQVELCDQGLFVVYENEVQFCLAENSKPIDQILEKPARVYKFEGNTDVRVLDFGNSIWVSLKDGLFRVYDKKSTAYAMDLQMECFDIFGKFIVYGYRSELVVARLESNYKLTKFNSLYGHKNNIYKVKVSVLLDIVVSVDRDGLVLLHQFETQKLLREFDLGTNMAVTTICIHEMGYLLFLTTNQRLIIFTYTMCQFRFLGELFLSQDIGINIKAVTQQITGMCIFVQNRSLLLLSTDKGNIYMVDMLEIKKFNHNSSYKQYSRIKVNVVEECPKLGDLSPIRQFHVKAMPGDTCLVYRVYVLYDGGDLLCYYSAQEHQLRLKSAKNSLDSLGLLDGSK